MESYMVVTITNDGEVLFCDGLHPNITFGENRTSWSLDDLSVIHGWQFKAVLRPGDGDNYYPILLFYRGDEGDRRSNLTDLIKLGTVE